MSSFLAAIDTVLLHEGIGGDAQDPGGPTHYGISLRFLKTLDELEQDGFLGGDRNHDGKIDAQGMLLAMCLILAVMGRCQRVNRFCRIVCHYAPHQR